MHDTQKNVNGPHLYHDHFQNFKRYNIPRAQLMIKSMHEEWIKSRKIGGLHA